MQEFEERTLQEIKENVFCPVCSRFHFMSQAAFSLHSAGIKLKGLKNSDKDRFKKESGD